MKPTKPTRPKGINRATSATRGRLPGFKPLYTPEQTQRYKSQALRYSKAVELSAGGPDYVEWNGQILSGDDAANLRDAGGRAFKLTDRVSFNYASERSKLDYWSVRYGGGGLEQVETFSDDITSFGTVACSVPVVAWGWESPKLDWAADGIKLCPGRTLPGSNPDGSGGAPGPSGDVPGSPSSNWYPAADGVPRTGTVTAANGFIYPFTINPGQFIQIASSTTIHGVNTITGRYEDVYGSALYVPGVPTLSLRSLVIVTDPFVDSLTGIVYPNGRVSDNTSNTHVIRFNQPPTSPPPSGPAGSFPPGPGGGGGYAPAPPPTIYDPVKATAGGTFTSNTFAASSAADVKVTLDYSTVPDIGDITGAIAVQLWSDGAGLVDELSETPTNGGAGSLEQMFNLEADQSYYFVIVIPEMVYCDAAVVAIGGAGFECNCPDYSKAQTVMLNSPYNSEQVERDWTGSGAGCDQEQGCKHVMGTKLFIGLPVAVPTDIPL